METATSDTVIKTNESITEQVVPVKEDIAPKTDAHKVSTVKPDTSRAGTVKTDASKTAGPDTSRTRARTTRSPRPRRGRGERARSEFDQVTIEVRRVARVMAGGRRFSFSVTVVIGDHKGRVGVGVGKGADTALAIEKATRNARRNLITVRRTDSGSITYPVSAKSTSSRVTIIPSRGRGIVAGSAMRTVLELSGVTDVVAKIFSRSKNKLTIARATVEALSTLAQVSTQKTPQT